MQLKPFVLIIQDHAIRGWQAEIYVIAKDWEDALVIADDGLEDGYHATEALTAAEAPEHAEAMSRLDTTTEGVYARGWDYMYEPGEG